MRSGFSHFATERFPAHFVPHLHALIGSVGVGEISN